MMANPHVLVEGVIISSFAIRANKAFIYIRGEVLHVIRRGQAAVDEAYAAGHLGEDIHGTGYDLDIVVHVGAGAYICGEETALLEGLEGRRGPGRGAWGPGGGTRAPATRSRRWPASTPARRSSTTWSRSRRCRASSS